MVVVPLGTCVYVNNGIPEQFVCLVYIFHIIWPISALYEFVCECSITSDRVGNLAAIHPIYFFMLVYFFSNPIS